MTLVSKRLPVLPAMLIGVALAFAVWGLLPSAAYANVEKQIDEVSFDNGYDSGWAQFFFVNNENPGVFFNGLGITVYDKDGVAVDPLTILDLSVVTDRENTLPEDYRIKYLNDQLVRPIDVSDLKIME